uniref:Dynamin-related protein 4C-like n=1 Tax=Tanacetum cinerariifolium TaxID=118510 RepID=A0A699R9Z7_TANCI|nr:dynamin-related protein 4C-like [Tanacetum cinerariifolium]
MGAGKSSVLESLSGISLPHGVLFQTRIPLKIKLQNHDDHHVPQFLLEYLDEKITIVEESNICEAIKKATIEIGGEG